MAINFGWVGIYNVEFPSIKVTRSFDRMVLQSHVRHTKRPKATKLGKVVTYYKKPQPIKSRNPLNTQSREVKTFHFHYHNTYGYQTW